MAVEIYKAIPNLDALRELKDGYRDHPIDRENILFTEPLVPLSDYGVPGVSYYSQPNKTTGEPVPGISPNIFVRRTVAEKLATVNEFLIAQDSLASLYGGRIELYVREGLRLPSLIKHLYENVMPGRLRTQHPEWSEEQLHERLNQVLAYPEWSETSVPPHFSGGAVDVALRNRDTGTLTHTMQGNSDLGVDSIHTDYLEDFARQGRLTDRFIQAAQGRRVLFNVMGSVEVGRIAMRNNPTETWHYSYGDQMWARLGHHAAALYGVPPVIPGELQQF